MGLALSGLASGFDWKSVVDQLIETSRAPQNRMRKEQSANATKTSALNDIKGLLSTLKSSLSALSSTESIQKKSATFADPTTKWTTSVASTASSGNYEFVMTKGATVAKLSGTTGISNKLDYVPFFGLTGSVTTPLTNLPIGRTITAGQITVNGNPVQINTSDSLDTVLASITSALGGGGAAVYNSTSDKIELSGVTALGASGDTSNFLQAMRLSGNGGGSGNVSSSSTLSSPLLTGPIDSANLSGWSTPGTGGQIKINGVGIDYSDSSQESIQSILAKINNSSAGVTASYDSTQGKFILTNKQTGDVGISVSDVTGNLASAMGLTSGTSLSPGTDAEFTVNGNGPYYSRSNALDESAHGIIGLTVNAKYDSVTAANNTQTITIGSDTSTAKQAINDFISNYNAVQSAIEKYTKVTVDGTKVTSAVLAGSRELASISRELRRILYASQNANGTPYVSGSIQRLSDIGVGFSGIENTISVTNSSTLDNQLSSNSSDLIQFFTTDNNGLVDRLGSMLDRLVSTSTSSPGTFQVQLDSISKQNKSLDKQIAEVDRRLEAQRAMLESSFIAMEKAQSSFQQQSSYLQRTFSGGSK